MKFSLEIKEDKVTVDYEIGESKHSGTYGISQQDIFLFSDIVKLYDNRGDYRIKDMKNELMLKEYLTKFPDRKNAAK